MPTADNYFAALNSAVFSDGSFVYVPKGVRSPMELSTYFRINASETGQVRHCTNWARAGAGCHGQRACSSCGHAGCGTSVCGWKNEGRSWAKWWSCVSPWELDKGVPGPMAQEHHVWQASGEITLELRIICSQGCMAFGLPKANCGHCVEL